IAVHDLSTSTLLNKFEITEESGTNLFAKAPVTERRLGKKVNEKDVDDIKKLIKALTKGTEGIMVSENKLGKLIVTVGTYDFIPLSHGGGGSWAGGFQQTQMTGSPNLASTGSTVYTWNPNMYYRPGLPGYSTTSARYYNTTYFKILLDPSTLKVARGSVPEPMSEQIKDYIETIDIKSKATNQFSIGKDQYYGYYDRDTKSYIIDQVRIR
ncbi:MAG TPA: hypothetical protein VGO09_05610, partial [Flavisolibacter sp.]|nr:hypothetical protein [Flavisolibacter sp.]